MITKELIPLRSDWVQIFTSSARTIEELNVPLIRHCFSPPTFLSSNGNSCRIFFILLRQFFTFHFNSICCFIKFFDIFSLNRKDIKTRMIFISHETMNKPTNWLKLLHSLVEIFTLLRSSEQTTTVSFNARKQEQQFGSKRWMKKF